MNEDPLTKTIYNELIAPLNRIRKTKIGHNENK